MKNPLGIKAFGMHLRQLREKKGLSQQQLANGSDLAKITIQRIENAKFRATLDVLISLSKGLNISISELVSFELPEEVLKDPL